MAEILETWGRNSARTSVLSFHLVRDDCVSDDTRQTLAERYRLLSADAYTAADQIFDPEARLIMRQIALSYDRLAWLTEDRSRRGAYPHIRRRSHARPRVGEP